MSEDLGVDDGRIGAESRKVYARPRDGESRQQFGERFLELILRAADESPVND